MVADIRLTFMKMHANNMREKVDRTDNAEAIAKKAAEEKRKTFSVDDRKDRIEVGKGVANAGVGMRMTGSAAPVEIPIEAEAVVGTSKRAALNEKRTWVGGSSEGKKMGGSHNVKGKL
jgi:hypothetical protein